MKRRAWAVALLTCLLLGPSIGCQTELPQPEPVIVATANTPPGRALGALTVLLLEDGGYAVVDKAGLGDSRAVRAALAEGTADIAWEYTGRTWLEHLRHDQPIFDAEMLYERIRAEDQSQQISWVAMAPLEDVPTLLVRSELVHRFGFRKISDLANHMNNVDPDMSLCTNEQLYRIPSGIPGLERVYRFGFDKALVQIMPLGDGYAAAAEGICDCVLGYPLEVEVGEFDLVALVDDHTFFPASNLAVGARMAALQEHPDLERILTQLAASITQRNLSRLLREMASDEQKAEVAARRFLSQHNVTGKTETTNDSQQ